MTSKRTYWLLAGLLILSLVVLVGGAYEVNALLTKQSAKLTSLKAKEQTLATEQQTLVKAKKDVQTYAPLETIAKSIVPQDKDQAEAVREIVNIASSAGVSLSSVVFPTSSLGVAPTAATGSSGSATTTAPTPIASKSLSQLQAVPSIPGVFSLQITIQNNQDNPVSYNQLYNFLRLLEQNRRTAQVTGISIQPISNHPNELTFTLTINEYIKPS